jgi:hypothetical protein
VLTICLQQDLLKGIGLNVELYEPSVVMDLEFIIEILKYVMYIKNLILNLKKGKMEIGLEKKKENQNKKGFGSANVFSKDKYGVVDEFLVDVELPHFKTGDFNVGISSPSLNEDDVNNDYSLFLPGSKKANVYPNPTLPSSIRMKFKITNIKIVIPSQTSLTYKRFESPTLVTCFSTEGILFIGPTPPFINMRYFAYSEFKTVAEGISQMWNSWPIIRKFVDDNVGMSQKFLQQIQIADSSFSPNVDITNANYNSQHPPWHDISFPVDIFNCIKEISLTISLLNVNVSVEQNYGLERDQMQYLICDFNPQIDFTQFDVYCSNSLIPLRTTSIYYGTPLRLKLLLSEILLLKQLVELINRFFFFVKDTLNEKKDYPKEEEEVIEQVPVNEKVTDLISSNRPLVKLPYTIPPEEENIIQKINDNNNYEKTNIIEIEKSYSPPAGPVVITKSDWIGVNEELDECDFDEPEDNIERKENIQHKVRKSAEERITNHRKNYLSSLARHFFIFAINCIQVFFLITIFLKFRLLGNPNI